MEKNNKNYSICLKFINISFKLMIIYIFGMIIERFECLYKDGRKL